MIKTKLILFILIALSAVSCVTPTNTGNANASGGRRSSAGAGTGHWPLPANCGHPHRRGTPQEADIALLNHLVRAQQ